MKIKRIYIGDFGIFREEKLEDLNGSIVVIGGYNRSGKSTFMHMLRHLGFGFSTNNGELPPANVEYKVSYDGETVEGEKYNVDLRGNKQPVVKELNFKKEASIDKLYGKIDYFTYKQLFTISLDELQNTELKNSKELNNMQTIFLGAGFREIVQVPQILKELEREAIKIGGKNGNPSTSQFKEYNKLIKEGVKLREKAASDVKEYYDKSREIEQLKKEIYMEENKIKNKEKRMYLLRMLKSNFSSYERKMDIQNEIKIIEDNDDIGNPKYEETEKYINLKKEYEDTLKRYEENIFQFRKITGGEKNFREKLNEHKDKIEYFNNNISGIKEKIKNYNTLKEKCTEKKEVIVRGIRDINEEWIVDFNKILNIKTDIISIDEINDNIDEYKSLAYDKNTIEKELRALELKKSDIDKIKPKNSYKEMDKLIKKYMYLFITLISLGVLVSFVDYKIGIILAISGSILTGAFAVIKYSSYFGKINNEEELIIDVENINEEIKEAREKYKAICEKVEINKSYIREYTSLLNLQREVSGETLKEYFRRVKENKNKIISLEEMINKVGEYGQELTRELTLIFTLVGKLVQIINEKEVERIEGDLIKNADNLFTSIKALNDYVSLNKELQIVEDKKNLLEVRIEKLIGKKIGKEEILVVLEECIEKSKKTKEILHLKKEREIIENTLQGVFDNSFMNNYPEYEGDYENIFNQYKMSIEIHHEYLNLEEEYKDNKQKIEGLKERLQDLKYKLEILKAEENIQRAEESINKGRRGLKALAKRYAALRGSEYILQRLQISFVEKTKDSLLKEASTYIREITKGEYVNILPPEDLNTLEFKTILRDGSIQNTPKVLSRATKEQLFLAVRLSRIKEIHPQLPLILDDSFVNFDEEHTQQVIKLILEISKTNQIFITTCHPQLVEYIAEQTTEAQYWKLEKGKFTLSDRNSLIEYLG